MNYPTCEVTCRHYFLRCIILIGLLSLCCVPGSATTAEIAPGITTPGISNHTAIIWRSAQIDGDRIVWAEHISNAGFVYNIYLYNITTGTETLISSLPPDGTGQDTYVMDEHPVAISGNRVVWTTDMGIRMYDITTGKRSTVIENSDDFGSHLVYLYSGISGDTIVWTERMAGGSRTPDIIAYDLTTGKKIVVSHGAWEKTGVRISGSRIIWEDYRKGGVDRDVYLYDLATGEERVICNASGTQYDPKISGDRIVWSDHRDLMNWDVYLYDLKTGTETAIASGIKEQEAADISGDRIIWMEWPSRHLYNPYDESNRLMMYDLSTGKEYQVLKDVPGMFAPAFSGNRIIFMDLAHIPADQRDNPWENTVQEISMFTLDPRVFPAPTMATNGLTGQSVVGELPANMIPDTSSTPSVPGFGALSVVMVTGVIALIIHQREKQARRCRPEVLDRWEMEKGGKK